MTNDEANKEIGRRLREARIAAGFEEIGEAAKKLGLPYSTYAGHENGNRGVVRASQRYASVFGVSLDWLLAGRGRGPGLLNPATHPFDHQEQVPLVGYIGAGQAVYPIDEGGYYVDAPPDATPSTVAAQVQGDSMLPAFEDGWLIYYSRHLPPEEMVNRRCVVQVGDGRLLIKTLRRGSAPGYWTLASSNAADIEDVPVEWVAPIDWIKPRL